MAKSHEQIWLKRAAIAALLCVFAVGGMWIAQRTASYPAPPQTALYATAAAPAQYTEAAAQARALAHKWLAERGWPGLSVAVGINGEIVWSEGFGYADLEQRVAVWPQSKFRIGSISKPLTAAAMALLVEEGKLDLDAPVQKYVPSFPQKPQPITSRQLAGHLAGIRHYKGEEFAIARRYNTVLESLEIFKNDPLLHPPGTKYSYSSYGWNLLSAVVEGASGQEFLAHMDARVFRPLGMRNTTADRNADIISNRVRFYERIQSGAANAPPSGPPSGEMKNAIYVDNSYKWAGGGFLSTAEDLVRFGSAHLRPGFLKKETLNLLITSQRTSSGEETNYGIGWQTRNSDVTGAKVYSHGGGSVGGTSVLVIFPESGVVVAMLVNLSGARFTNGDARQLAELFVK